jgi:hypothetical protein
VLPRFQDEPIASRKIREVVNAVRSRVHVDRINVDVKVIVEKLFALHSIKSLKNPLEYLPWQGAQPIETLFSV